MTATEPQRQLRLKCLACEALARITYLCAAQSPHLVDLTMYEIGLHNRPGELKAKLQAAIDETDPTKYDAVVMVYGLCGQATLGLQARHVPLVIPKPTIASPSFWGIGRATGRLLSRSREHIGTPATTSNAKPAAASLWAQDWK
jgi:hypothetical protein